MPEEQHNGRRQLPPPEGDPQPQYLSGDAGRLNDPSQFPFGTCPKWVDGTLVINQSNVILRHLARATQLYGTTAAETALVDSWLDHVEDVRKAYSDVVYGLDEPPFDAALTNDDPKCVAAFAAHAPSVTVAFTPCERQLASSAAGVLVGDDAITVADIALYDIFEVHLRLWADVLSAADFPMLHAHRASVAAQPGIAAYLQSGKRWSRLNGNALG